MKNYKQNILNTLKSFLAVTVIAVSTVTHADDTEVFETVNIANNMLFVLDVSGSMKDKVVTVTTTGGTTTSNGTPGLVGGTNGLPVAQSQDDATEQLVASGGGAGAGDQYWDDDDLDFQPDHIVGVRFPFDVGTIPRVGRSHPWYGWNERAKVSAVRIKDATMRFRASSTNTDSTEIDVYIENDAARYAASEYNNDNSDYYYYYYDDNFPKIEERPKYGPVRWSPGNWTADTGYDVVDVKNLVQQVVNREDWDKKIHHRWYKSTLAFKFKTVSGQRHAYSWEGATYWSEVPHLDVEYDYDVKYRKRERVNHKWKWVWHTHTYTAGNGYFSGEVHARTETRYDDAEQEWAETSPTTSYIEPQWEFNADQAIGVRFDLNPSNQIPKEAVINKAYIQFTSASASSADAKINIQIEDTGFAKDYQDTPAILSRSYNEDTQKDWIPPVWASGEKNDNQKTPDLIRMVQHVVNRSDWNNALAFRFFGETGDRIAYAMDSGNPPVLHIEYQDIGGATSGTTTGPGGTVTTTRVEKRIVLMQEALREVLETAPNVNVGLMKYSGMERDSNRGFNVDKRNHYVGGVLFPVSPVYEKASDYIGAFEANDNLPDPGAKTVRQYVADVADQWEPYGGTPIVDALYEAALYYRGEMMHYGKNKNNGGDDFTSPGSHPSTYFSGAQIDDDVRDVGRSNIANARYKSPIKNECQSNYIVLMSDGAPTYYYNNAPSGSNGAGPFALTLKGSAVSELAFAIPSCLTGNGENADTSVTRLTAGTCGREITQYLAKNDQMPDAGRGANAGVKEEQTVKTFTIGFGSGLEDGAKEYLESLATVDGQGYYTADNKEELKDAFQKIFDTVAKAKGSLSSPGYSVNVKSGLEHEDDIYIPVFDRKNTSRWSGNLKKFKLVNDHGKRKIRGKNHKDAVDELGGFTDESKDYWSNNTQPDGLDIQKGGAAELIDPVGRLVYTNAGCSENCELTSNKLELSNTAIDSAVLGIDNQGLSDITKATRRERLINFARGWEDGFYDANATPHGVKRHYMGDMLHSEPLVITYRKDGNAAGKQQYIFAGTNEGYLHAFDTASGEEKFAFMPAELLKNQDDLLKNEGTYRDHKYGVDGVMSYWHDDANHNKEVDTGETVYLYFGLRRGGRSYYALDITDMDSPKLLWSVTGEGNIDTNTTSPWASLGQTWSAPYLARVGLSDGSKKEVVIFTGGYDPVEDRDKPGNRHDLDSSTKTVSTKMGQNIFIVDAKTGGLLWSLRESMGDTTSLTHSLPGGFRMLDVNRNGLVDRLYFADTGGYVWRLDLSESLSKTGDTKSVLTEFAYLGGSDSDSRKFYNEPDVAMMRPDGKTLFAVSIGSGFRAHPNDKVIEDKMFVLRDVSPYEPLPNDFTRITKDKLASVSISTSNDVISLTHSGFGDTDKDKGWFLSLPDGEKVLAQAITFDGVITFTTMVPQVLTHGVDPCKAPKAFGRLYALNILTGESVIDLDEDDAVDDDDAYIPVVKGEIPGKPQIIFNKFTKKVVSTDADSGEVTKTSCSHPVDIRVGKKLSQVTGYDACRLESVYWNDPQQK